MTAFEALWPPEDRISKTLGTDAQSLAPAVVLAVHQPMQFRRLPFGSESLREAPIASEKDLLEALLLQEGEGRVIIPIAGPSGAGKSHVIKWLEAELAARDDAVARHVIVVPKNSSLKSVLRLILRDLEGAQFDGIREDLERASESIPEVAARDLRTRIVQALKSKAAAAERRLRAGTSENRKDDEATKWGGQLAALLDEGTLWDGHFYRESGDGVVGLLARNVTQEGPAERRRQFAAEDFEGLLTAVGDNVADLSRPVRALIPQLQSPEARKIAAEVHNRVLDSATQALMDLGGTPLSEIFLRLRRALLEVPKELVILVEDFAVLSGMQDALLKALVQEARVGGNWEYCTIRSAIAYTRGYRGIDLDTLQTRADAQWIIEKAPGSEEDILERSVELVGAYLNAARWGAETLTSQRQESGKASGWIEVFEAETDDEDARYAIECFGRSEAGYPLFPLNRQAIRQLVREKSTDSDELVFNPRLIIQRVVLEILRYRRTFVKRQFPPSSLGSAKLTATEVVGTIGRQPAADQPRLITLVTYWAELPETRGAAARLPGEVYEAFGLQVVDFGSPSEAPPREVVRANAAVALTPATSASLDPFDEKWKPTLDEWLRGSRLLGADARDLRTWMAAAMMDPLPSSWPGVRTVLKKDNLARQHVYLPNARGALDLTYESAFVALCSEEEWAEPLKAIAYRQELEAVIRFHGIDATKGHWAYPGGEQHAAQYAKFVSRRSAHLRKCLVQRGIRHLPELDLRSLVEERLVSAALLGVGVRSGSRLQSALDVLFHSLPQPKSADDQPKAWRDALTLAYRRADEARQDLVEMTAARQGTGAKVLAIDVAQIESEARAFLQSWEWSEGPKSHSDFARDIDRGIEARQGDLTTWYGHVVNWLGEGFVKDDCVSGVRDLLTAAKRANLARDGQIAGLRELVKRLQKANLSVAIADGARVAGQSKRDGPWLVALAQEHGAVVELTRELSNQLDSFLQQVEREAVESGRAGKDEFDAMSALMRTELEELAAVVARYEEVDRGGA